MFAGCTLWNENTRALTIPDDLAVKVNFQLALEYEPNMALLAPVRLNKLGSEFDQAHLLPSVAEDLETGAGHCRLPL